MDCALFAFLNRIESNIVIVRTTAIHAIVDTTLCCSTAKILIVQKINSGVISQYTIHNNRHNTLLHDNRGSNSSGNQFGSNFSRSYQDIRKSVASNSMRYDSNSNSAETQLEKSFGENFYTIRQDINSCPVRSNPNSSANYSDQQVNSD